MVQVCCQYLAAHTPVQPKSVWQSRFTAEQTLQLLFAAKGPYCGLRWEEKRKRVESVAALVCGTTPCLPMGIRGYRKGCKQMQVCPEKYYDANNREKVGLVKYRRRECGRSRLRSFVNGQKLAMVGSGQKVQWGSKQKGGTRKWRTKGVALRDWLDTHACRGYIHMYR